MVVKKINDVTVNDGISEFSPIFFWPSLYSSSIICIVHNGLMANPYTLSRFFIRDLAA
jgi:hypothetical protein